MTGSSVENCYIWRPGSHGIFRFPSNTQPDTKAFKEIAMVELRFDEDLKRSVSEPTQKVLTLFPEMLIRQQNILRGYHEHISNVLTLRTDDPMIDLKGSTRQIATMYLTKTIYYSRAIIENMNSRNLLVAFQCMRALVEVVAAVRYTMHQMLPIIKTCTERGTVTAQEAHQLNYHCDLLLHGGRFDWTRFFEKGAWDILKGKNREHTEDERKQHANKMRFLQIGTCIKDWSEDNQFAGFAYDYLCDLVHPNKGSNLTIIVETEHGPLFDVDGPAALGIHIFDRIFPIVVKLCAGEFRQLILSFTALGAGET
jgi:hypothetical protein